MNMRMIKQVLSPRMKKTEKSEMRSKVLGIGADLKQGFSASGEQEFVQHAFVVQSEC
jgi:hypothetical protein